MSGVPAGPSPRLRGRSGTSASSPEVGVGERRGAHDHGPRCGCADHRVGGPVSIEGSSGGHEWRGSRESAASTSRGCRSPPSSTSGRWPSRCRHHAVNGLVAWPRRLAAPGLAPPRTASRWEPNCGHADDDILVANRPVATPSSDACCETPAGVAEDGILLQELGGVAEDGTLLIRAGGANEREILRQSFGQRRPRPHSEASGWSFGR